jgi:hypothetical protein
MKKPFYV